MFVCIRTRQSNLHLARTTGTEHVGRVHHRTQLAAHRTVYKKTTIKNEGKIQRSIRKTNME